MSNRNLPNIIYINWHDAGRYFGCYQRKSMYTPNLDALAADGVLFENFFCASPKCSPSRGSMTTGQYPQSNGLLGLCHGDFNWRLNDVREHISHLLHDRGYFTTLQGFQHEVHGNERDQLGFDLFNNHEQIAPTWQVPPCEIIAEGAVNFFMSSQATNKPFYMQVGFFEAHRNYGFGGAKPDAEYGTQIPSFCVDNAVIREDMQEFQGSVRKADAAVGVILDGLRKSGLDKNSIVVFSVDHGIHLPAAKSTLYDAGLEIPFIIRWPNGGISGEKRSSRLSSNVDFVPTIFEICGLERPSNMDGLSFANELGPWNGSEPRKFIHAAFLHETRAVRSDQFKLIQNYAPLVDAIKPVDLDLQDFSGKGKFPDTQKTRVLPAVEFYDLEQDPDEMHNVAGNPKYEKELDLFRAEMKQWMLEVNDPCCKLPFPELPRKREIVQRIF